MGAICFADEILNDVDAFLLRLFSWKWRGLFQVGYEQRTNEEAKEALHAARESRYPEAAFTGEGADLEALKRPNLRAVRVVDEVDKFQIADALEGGLGQHHAVFGGLRRFNGMKTRGL